MSRIIVLLIATQLFSFPAFSQSGWPEPYGAQPEVGKPMPDFTLGNITHYTTTSASLKELRGKWLFLDFWFTACVSCIQAFPKINALQKEFGDQAQFMLVGINKEQHFSGGNIEKVYEKIRERQNLQLTSAYDSVLMYRWGITSMPHIIIIDPEGIVRFITNGMDMTAEKVRKLVNGEEVSFYRKDRVRPEYNIATFPGSPNDKLVYRSILTRSDGERSVSTLFDEFVKWPIEYRRDGIVVTSQSLSTLYLTAFIGDSQWRGSKDEDGLYYYPDIIYEIKDKSLFDYDPTTPDFKGLYSYNLALPLSQSDNLDRIKKIFQQELKTVFGCEATLEKRMMPAWKLVAKPGVAQKLKTKGGKRYVGDGTGSGAMPAGFKAVNISSTDFMDLITYYITGKSFPFFLDETSIMHNVDINFSADMASFKDIKRELQKHGLDLVLEDKEFRVLVLRDPKD